MGRGRHRLWEGSRSGKEEGGLMSHLLRWATFVSLAGAVCLLTATPALAKTIHVHPGQSIQAAINAAKPGDTIVVDAGVYHENLVITKDRLQLEGAGPGATVLV